MHLPDPQSIDVELKIENVDAKPTKPAMIWTDLQIEQWEETDN
jgi:hypothetical protein